MTARRRPQTPTAPPRAALPATVYIAAALLAAWNLFLLWMATAG